MANPKQDYKLHPVVQEENKVTIIVPSWVGEEVLRVDLYKVEPPRPVDEYLCMAIMNEGHPPHYSVDVGDEVVFDLASRDTQIIACAQGDLLGSVTHLFVDAWQNEQAEVGVTKGRVKRVPMQNNLVSHILFPHMFRHSTGASIKSAGFRRPFASRSAL